MLTIFTLFVYTKQEVEQIDLIREAKKLPLPEPTSSIGNPKTENLPGSKSSVGSVPTEDSEPNTDSESYSDLAPYTKLEEIDLLSSIGRDIGVDLEKYVQPVPDVLLMDNSVLDVSKSGSCRVGAADEIDGNIVVKDVASIVSNRRDLLDTNKFLETNPPAAPAPTSAPPVTDTRKKEKMVRNQARRRQQNHPNQPQRRPDKRRADTDVGGPGIYKQLLRFKK